MDKIVLVDIDGTISKVGDRLKHITKPDPDWDSFYEACVEDAPIHPIINLVSLLCEKYDIVYCTGRRESVRTKTMMWLNYYLRVPCRDLLMRKDGDKRHDTIVKPELLSEANLSIKDIAYVLEDRNSMVSMWRGLGLTVLQPADGDF